MSRHMIFHKRRAYVWGVFGVALLVRIAYLWLIFQHTTIDAIAKSPPDSRLYLGLARSFLTGQPDLHSLYMAGFGYALFLNGFLAVVNSLAVVIFGQIVLSAATSALLALVTSELFESRPAGWVAGLLHAMALTPAALAGSFLSETLFFFLIVLSLLLYLRALKDPSFPLQVGLTVTLAYAVFTRSVASLFALALLAHALLFCRAVATKSFRRRFTMIVGAVYLLTGAWAWRNYVVHDVFTIAGTGPAAAATYLGGRVKAEQDGDSTPSYWRDRYFTDLRGLRPDSAGSYRFVFEGATGILKSLWRENAPAFVSSYLGIVVENMFVFETVSMLRAQPDISPTLHRWRETDQYLTLAMWWIALLGAIALCRKRKVAISLSVLVAGYFVATSGFTCGQGSRIIYPACAGVLPLAAIGLTGAFGRSQRLIEVARRRRSEGASWRALTHESLAFLRHRGVLHFLGGALVMLAISFLNNFQVGGEVERKVIREFTPYSFSGGVDVTNVHQIMTHERFRRVEFEVTLRDSIAMPYRCYLHLMPVGRDTMLNRDFRLERQLSEYHPGDNITITSRFICPPGTYRVIWGFFGDAGGLGGPCQFTMTVP